MEENILYGLQFHVFLQRLLAGQGEGHTMNSLKLLGKMKGSLN